MKLIILGNGFDLHHNYKTSFNDFRTHLQNSNKSEDKGLITKIDQLLDLSKEKQKTQLLWNDFETIIGKIIKSSSYQYHKRYSKPN